VDRRVFARNGAITPNNNTITTARCAPGTTGGDGAKARGDDVTKPKNHDPGQEIYGCHFGGAGARLG